MIDDFGPAALDTCHKHLKNSSKYYLPKTTNELFSSSRGTWWDCGDCGGESFVTNRMTELFDPFFSPRCLSNVESIFCHAAFKECKAVQQPNVEEEIWLPSLLCRSECEKQSSIWEECLEQLKKDAAAKEAFDNGIRVKVHMSRIDEMVSLCSFTIAPGCPQPSCGFS